MRGLRDLVGRGHALGRSSAAAGRSAEDLDLLLATTRAVLRSSSVAEVTNALVAYVHVVGGDVIGASAAGSDALPFDVSFGDGEPLLVVAEEPSVVRLRLEHTLPALVDDARRIVALLRAIDA